MWDNLHKHSHHPAKMPLHINNANRPTNHFKLSLHNIVMSQFSLKTMSQQKLDMNHSPALNSSLQAWHSGFALFILLSAQARNQAI